MRILVTGGNGFIGRHVVAEAVRRGRAVRVLSRAPAEPGLDPPRAAVEFVAHDLRHPDGLAGALEGIDAVIHCSAAMSGSLEAQLAVTVQGTAHLLDAMQAAGVRHIVGLSSLAVYDCLRQPAGSLLDEDSLLEENFDGRAPYIRAKRLQEDLIRQRAGSSGWRWTILRPGIVFGRGRTWFHHLGMRLGARRWVCLAGESLLPLTYVENCAAAILDALDTAGADGATLNIVDDDAPERRRYVDWLSRRTEPRPDVASVPWALLDRASRSASWANAALLFGRAPLPDLLRPASLHARCKPLLYSNRRARQVLGWRPRWSLEEGFVRSFAAGS